jgi:hypothetical protein
MSGFIQGEDRFQATLFPERLDDYVAEDSAVRVIDVFLDDLDLSGLGFKTQPNDTGRPAYHPSTMLKLFVYGYLNRVQSSRRLEIEAQRNVELMWLTGRLAPDKQISLTDPDARSMKTRGAGIVGYNVQTAVDTKHHIVVAHEVTNKGSDRHQPQNRGDCCYARLCRQHGVLPCVQALDRYFTESISTTDRAVKKCH